ncbi:MAG: prepilin-type N-terminal cleavage/methylation domain-containing protein, partial [Proteobacteria bacterium]
MSRARGTQRGFNLVELMVAMGLSLVLLAGALSILYSSKVTHAENDRIARLQEAGRTVVELILRDARASGFQGCARPMNPAFIGSVVDAASAADVRWNMLQPVYGYEATGGAWTPALDAAVMPNATAGSDVIVLRTTREGMPVFRLTSSVVNLGANLPVVGPAGATLPVPSTAMISDCQFATFFVVTGFAAGAGGTASIAHGTGGAPSNQTTSVDRPFMV